MNNKETAQRIVDRMLEEINAGATLPWVKPWGKGKPTKVRVVDGVTTITIPVEHWSRSGKAYQGINNLLLDIYGKSGEMITFNQCKAEGGKVKKGAKAATIVYWNMIKKVEDLVDEDGNPVLDEDGNQKKRTVTIPVLKEYKVFSVEDDCEGLKTKHHPDPITITSEKWHWEPIPGEPIDESLYNPAAESIIADYVNRAKLTVNRDDTSDRAFYRPFFHDVTVPNVTQFKQVEEYYSTLFHELGHSTGHSSLLNRFTGKAATAAFGSEEYSREELVAEITAATILNTLGIESGNSFRNSTAYIKSWSEHIKNDPMMFVVAAGRADKAVDLILNIAG